MNTYKDYGIKPTPKGCAGPSPPGHRIKASLNWDGVKGKDFKQPKEGRDWLLLSHTSI